jgi:hypothetical protein
VCRSQERARSLVVVAIDGQTIWNSSLTILDQRWRILTPDSAAFAP